ncbi:hypothetical protein GIB67_000497 [Kingdonia uniflora]|uniref:Uncharacterized protein n=1 Tax=Kingdonia uniflora TaxID=39325 RepID=A0A7J7L0G6_9MAGN|nr:hypothetical protein GIB67_000497 [Kingdonia uniflora]
MTKWHDRVVENIELHRLRNRVRQQKYRARKREEKAKIEGETPLLANLFIDVTNVTNKHHVLRQNASELIPKNIEAANGTRSSDLVQEDNNSCLEDVESSQGRCTLRHQEKQQEEEESKAERLRTDAEEDVGFSRRDSHTFSAQEVDPLSQIEHGCTGASNVFEIQYCYAMKPLDQRDHSRIDNNIMVRRLKNRERQRRYRARKRLETEMKGANLMKTPTPLTVVSQHNGFISKCITRVHCKRDWKEDARKAYKHKEPGISVDVSKLPSEDQPAHISPSEIKVKFEPQVESLNDDESNGVIHGRRDWKMAARNKVD